VKEICFGRDYFQKGEGFEKIELGLQKTTSDVFLEYLKPKL